jgi:hypothetical protein
LILKNRRRISGGFFMPERGGGLVRNPSSLSRRLRAQWGKSYAPATARQSTENQKWKDHGDPAEISYFPLAKGALVPSLPVPCQESEEKQKHGKPLPSVSKSLGQGKFFVVNKGLATCCKARTANASVVLVKLLSSPMLTFATSERIFLFPGNLEITATNNSPVRESDGLYTA